MKLSEFLKHIEDGVNKAAKTSPDKRPDADPEIIFSIGKPTDNKMLEVQGMGIAGTPSGKISFFIDFRPARNLHQELENMLRESLGDEKAEEIIGRAKEAAATIQEDINANS